MSKNKNIFELTLIHLVVYVLVNAMLIAINFIYPPEAIWFFYPLIGWELEYGVLSATTLTLSAAYDSDKENQRSPKSPSATSFI